MVGGQGTRTGKVLEAAIKQALTSNGYSFEEQSGIGEKLFGGTYKADFVVNTTDRKVIISCKWQQTSGTVEQKILYEIASLIEIIRTNPDEYRKAYVVIGGKGFSPKFKKSLLNQKHIKVLQNGDLVEVVDLEEMITRLNRGNI